MPAPTIDRSVAHARGFAQPPGPGQAAYDPAPRSTRRTRSTARPSTASTSSARVTSGCALPPARGAVSASRWIANTARPTVCPARVRRARASAASSSASTRLDSARQRRYSCGRSGSSGGWSGNSSRQPSGLLLDEREERVEGRRIRSRIGASIASGRRMKSAAPRAAGASTSTNSACLDGKWSYSTVRATPAARRDPADATPPRSRAAANSS